MAELLNSRELQMATHENVNRDGSLNFVERARLTDRCYRAPLAQAGWAALVIVGGSPQITPSALQASSSDALWSSSSQKTSWLCSPGVGIGPTAPGVSENFPVSPATKVLPPLRSSVSTNIRRCHR